MRRRPTTELLLGVVLTSLGAFVLLWGAWVVYETIRLFTRP